MEMEIVVVTGSGQGHLHPCINLCLHLTKRHFRTTLVFSSPLSSSIPSSFLQSPLISTAPIAPSPMLAPSPQSEHDLHSYLLSRTTSALCCAIVDFQMGWTKHVFWKFNIPVIALFTFGGCAAAMEWAAWKLQAAPCEILGLPPQMAITHFDLKRKPFTGAGRGPPQPGDRPPWVPQIEGSIALMFNSCDDLDGRFIRYMADQTGLPAWGVGPLLPDHYWVSDTDSDSPQHIIQWLDSQPRGSVLYVAFGSEVGPTIEEYEQLAEALQNSTRPFIWVIQPNKSYSPPENLDKNVRDRGLIVKGWAPQLQILGHASTGGFLSHCGWNSTMEAIGVGVPILAWPIRGDQFYNAKLVVCHLKLGYKVADDLSQMVQKDDILLGIERLMADEDMRHRALLMKAKLKDSGFPATSQAALDSFTEFLINPKTNI